MVGKFLSHRTTLTSQQIFLLMQEMVLLSMLVMEVIPLVVNLLILEQLTVQ